MELIAETGGVVCTWPMRYWGRTVPKKNFCSMPHRYLRSSVPWQTVEYSPERAWWHDSPRETFDHWAQEIKVMMDYLCPAQVGLGTDAGGMINFPIEGYSGYADLPKLVRAMERVGLSRENIKAYLGGNFLRVMTEVLG
jgi:microsomal dipeptidase-like Zn-dependent dipeptidase